MNQPFGQSQNEFIGSNQQNLDLENINSMMSSLNLENFNNNNLFGFNNNNNLNQVQDEGSSNAARRRSMFVPVSEPVWNSNQRPDCIRSWKI